MCPKENNIEKSRIETYAPIQGLRMPTLNMGSNRNVLAKRFIPEGEANFVFLDESPNITLEHWHINIVKMFSDKKHTVLSAKFLLDIVTSYKLSLPNKLLLNTNTERFSSCIIHHLNFIHECFHDMEYHGISVHETTDYFSMLEDILAVYCSVELKIVSKIYFKPNSNNGDSDKIIMTDEMMYLKHLSKQAQKMAFILHNFLQRNENVLHVLMKMWYSRESSSCVVTMRYLYTLLLYDKPITDKSDESYCRYVINYLLWTLIERKDAATNSAESMIGVLNKKFGYNNNEIPDTPFIKKVLDISCNLLDFVNMIHIQSSVIERYFLEIKKNQQSRMFHVDTNANSCPYELFLLDVNDAEEINNRTSNRNHETECSDSNSVDVDEITKLDSDIIVISDDDDDVQVISSSSSAPQLSTSRSIRNKHLPILHLDASLQSGTVTTTTVSSKVQRTPQRSTSHFNSIILQSILRTIADVVRKVQSGNSEQSVCLNRGSVRDTNSSDVREKLSTKQVQVGSRRTTVNVNFTSELCSTIINMSGDGNSGLHEDHDTGQAQCSRKENSSSNSIKALSQSTQAPEHIYHLPPPSIIFKIITLNKVQPVELNEPEYTSENGVKGLLGSDVTHLGHQAIRSVHTVEVMHVATDMTHAACVRDKAFVQVVSQLDMDVEKSISVVRTASRSEEQVEIDTEDDYDSILSKEVLTDSCVNLLLRDSNQMPEFGRKRRYNIKDFNFPNSSPSDHMSEIFDDDTNIFITTSHSSTPTNFEELTQEEEEALNRILHESMAHMNNTEYEENGIETTRLPFKKRRMSDSGKTDVTDASYEQSEHKQRDSSSNSQSKYSTCLCEEPSINTLSDISYPATKMISIAELQEQNCHRPFKTAAERKDMSVNIPTNILRAGAVPFTNNSLFTPFQQCHGNRDDTI